MTIFLCHFEQNGANMSVIKIAGRNPIFSPLGIEVKLIKNVLPLELDDDFQQLDCVVCYSITCTY